MPGKILNIKVSAGQAVKFGETVIVMEAMKMETEIVAPADGTVVSTDSCQKQATPLTQVQHWLPELIDDTMINSNCLQKEFSELKILYDTVQATDFADLEYKASAKSVGHTCVNSNDKHSKGRKNYEICC